jgi:dimethylhistidine N-methyltransferase
MSARAAYSFYDLQPDAGTFLGDVLSGLALPQKALPPKYFYDARGSELFEAICDLPEYYPTRTELAMMQADAAAMARFLGSDCMLIEYGAGSGRKTRVLIEALAPMAYVAIDISREQLRSAVKELAKMFPSVKMVGVCADYSRPIALPEIDNVGARRRAIYFPGSTIGNFTRDEALAFLVNARALAGAGGAMLVGVDIKKDAALLNAAYNDTQGVTAEFNLNVLHRINNELGANFDTDAFRHSAFYDPVKGRIEMHLESKCEQSVLIAGRDFGFRAGETIHTENSCKYSVEEFQRLAQNAGFCPEYCWVDPGQLFSIHYLSVPT